MLIGYEVFSTRRKWGLPPNDYGDDPWRTLWEDLYDWFSGPRVALVLTIMSALAFSLGTGLATSQFTPSTYVCFELTDSRLYTLLLQVFGVLLDGVIVTLLWRLLAWSRTTKLRLRTLAWALLSSAGSTLLLWATRSVWAGSRPDRVALGSLYAFDVIVDSFSFAFLIVAATLWVCETSPITPAAIMTFMSGIWSSCQIILQVGNWEHVSRAAVLGPMWLIIPGAILFLYSHDLRMVLLVRRFFFTAILAVLLLTITIFALVKPGEIFDRRHPINELVYRARIEQDRWLREVSVSTTETVAVKTYEERHHGRHPPPHFSAWFQVAKGTTIVDDYPQIDRDLAPFWRLSPGEIRRRAEVMASEPGIATVSIRGGQASHGGADDAAAIQDLDELVDFIQSFSVQLPDMILPINLSPTPRVLSSWEDQQAHPNSLANPLWRRSLDDTAESETQGAPEAIAEETESAKASISTNDFRRMQTQACPPGTLARQDADWTVARLCSACASGHSQGQLLSNFDRALEVCEQPDLRNLHGFLMSKPSTPLTDTLLPLFGASKTDHFKDIIIPLPRTMKYKDDIIWDFERRYDSLVWRGNAGKQDLDLYALRGSHKYRLLHLVLNPTADGETTMVLPSPGAGGGFRYERVSMSEANTVVPISAGLDDYSGCEGSACELARVAYGIKDDKTKILEYRYVLLMDEDDGPPDQLLRTLRSHSVPFLSTIFRTWYTERLMPWLHFVPIDPRFQALHSTVAYFTGTESRPKVNGRDTAMPGQRENAEWIAQAGKRWADKALSRKEMEVYLFRLLLEWGRLIDDRRDDIGTWIDKDQGGLLTDSGWSNGAT